MCWVYSSSDVRDVSSLERARLTQYQSVPARSFGASVLQGSPLRRARTTRVAFEMSELHLQIAQMRSTYWGPPLSQWCQTMSF